MKTSDVQRIREKLGLERKEFAELLCLSGVQPFKNIETGQKKPGKLIIRILHYLDSVSKKEALTFIEEFKKHPFRWEKW